MPLRATAMAITSAKDIPTLSLLYKLKKLDISKLGPMKGTSPAYNDRIRLFRGDITCLSVDAIVNAANTSLLGGGGVDGAIHRAAGRGLLAECRTLNGCETGSAKITDAYELPCTKVIHTVGPVYNVINPGKSEIALRGCYRSSLQLAADNGLKSLAFSGISTGIYGYPSMDAAVIACATVKEFLDGQDGHKLDSVIFVTFEEKDVRAYNHVLPRFFPPSNETPSDQEKAIEEQTAEAKAKADQLPDVPTTDPADPQHAQKKQKQAEDV
ncbi:MACRO domain-containing protein [Xylariaceae sp. FL0016]|nr:MACRO domain-containing protein [Xylariaceae sp. FL0016]